MVGYQKEPNKRWLPPSFSLEWRRETDDYQRQLGLFHGADQLCHVSNAGAISIWTVAVSVSGYYCFFKIKPLVGLMFVVFCMLCVCIDCSLWDWHLQLQRLVGTQYYLERDLEEPCYVSGGRHQTMLWVLAIPALLVYAVGMPVGSFVVLWKARNQLNTNKYRFRLGLLYSGYRKDRWWWEFLVATRKGKCPCFVFLQDPPWSLIFSYFFSRCVCLTIKKFPKTKSSL